MTAPRPRERTAGRTVRLRPSNPFDLIRLLALSQSDPRKAMAELVQNSLDAGARNVTVSRYRRRGEVVLAIGDDGRGIFPELERPEALERIATHVGHSFKRNLSPAERKEQMLAGKYGIGILGFWAVGRELEMRSRIGGSEVWALRLRQESEEATVARVPQQQLSLAGDTFTEVVIRGVHPGAARVLTARKLADYLGSELRGQILERAVKLRMVDRLAQRSDLKDFLVVPQRYRGRRVEIPAELPIAGRSPARLEIYFVGEAEGERPAVALTCGGTMVAPDLSALEEFETARPPWSSGAFEGFVEFPDLEVAPATRRGFVPGPAAEDLFRALRTIEPSLLAFLERERERQNEEEDEEIVREIRNVFRPLAKSLPQYDFFEISREREEKLETPPGARPEEEGAQLGRRGDPEGAVPEPAASEVVEEGDAPEPPAELLPPGPLESARIVPRRLKLLPGASRDLVARALDSTGRRILEGVEFRWSIREGNGSLAPEGDRARYRAAEGTGAVRITLEARQGDRASSAEAGIEVVEKLAGERPDAGIPEPRRVVDPSGDWRSRVRGRSWEYNAAHPDYQAATEEPRRRFRYLVHLFAKEMVLRNYGEPKDDRLLERMVEVLTHIRARG